MVTNTLTLNQTQPALPQVLQPQFNSYRYDQLNRIKEMNSVQIRANGSLKTSFASTYSYDKNGNLKTLQRTTDNDLVDKRLMDDFTYHYTAETNKLRYIDDTVPDNRYSDDIDDQDLDLSDPVNPDNYVYNAIGQLIQDKAEGLTIEWRVDGKVKRVLKNDNTEIEFRYDALGRRYAKKVIGTGLNTTSYYLRDAEGKVLSIYDLEETKLNTGTITDTKFFLKERTIYGRSRLGIEQSSILLNDLEAKLSSKSEASVVSKVAETNSQAVVLAGTVAGLNFLGDNQTTWNDDGILLNFFDQFSPITPTFEILGHLKIDENDATFLDGQERHIGTIFDGGRIGAAQEQRISGVQVSVRKTAAGFRPV